MWTTNNQNTELSTSSSGLLYFFSIQLSGYIRLSSLLSTCKLYYLTLHICISALQIQKAAAVHLKWSSHCL